MTLSIALVGDDEWSVVGWLWQAFQQDLAPILGALPYADGRYQWGRLLHVPSRDTAGYVAWRPHPNTGERAPVAFSVATGLDLPRRTLTAFWVAPAARGDRIGLTLARHTIAAHPGLWSIPFQENNIVAAAFWRRVADEAFGVGRWDETPRAVPHRPEAPPDHWIENR